MMNEKKQENSKFCIRIRNMHSFEQSNRMSSITESCTDTQPLWYVLWSFHHHPFYIFCVIIIQYAWKNKETKQITNYLVKYECMKYHKSNTYNSRWTTSGIKTPTNKIHSILSTDREKAKGESLNNKILYITVVDGCGSLM